MADRYNGSPERLLHFLEQVIQYLQGNKTCLATGFEPFVLSLLTGRALEWAGELWDRGDIPCVSAEVFLGLLDEEFGLKAPPAALERQPAPPAALERQPAPPAALERQPAPPAALERQPAPPAALERQPAPPAALERQPAPPAALERQPAPPAALERQPAPPAALERQPAPPAAPFICPPQPHYILQNR
uniref:DUF4939 domain-containing protein n=1 Tax=Esox lucius TaxID=8010 RepID=A0AAY5KP86_ESOLU